MRIAITDEIDYLVVLKYSFLLSGTVHSDPFQTNQRRTICLDIMVLAYLLASACWMLQIVST